MYMDLLYIYTSHATYTNNTAHQQYSSPYTYSKTLIKRAPNIKWIEGTIEKIAQIVRKASNLWHKLDAFHKI